MRELDLSLCLPPSLTPSFYFSPSWPVSTSLLIGWYTSEVIGDDPVLGIHNRFSIVYCVCIGRRTAREL